MSPSDLVATSAAP